MIQAYTNAAKTGECLQIPNMRRNITCRIPISIPSLPVLKADVISFWPWPPFDYTPDALIQDTFVNLLFGVISLPTVYFRGMRLHLIEHVTFITGKYHD